MEAGLNGQLGLNVLEVVAEDLNPIQEHALILDHPVEVNSVLELENRQNCVILIHVQLVNVYFLLAEIEKKL
jgi:hypothetical protein